MKFEEWLINLIVVAVIIGVIAFAIQSYGNGRFQAGKDEVQALWNADKAVRKAEADKQEADTLKTNKGNEDAFRKNQADLRDARGNLSTVLKRLRDLPTLSRDEGLPMAGSGQAAVPGVAGDRRGAGIGVEQRIGSCEDTSSEPCYVSRYFFDQALNDALDRGFTRQWAAGQGIKTVGDKRE